jgi:hypothetical protein
MIKALWRISVASLLAVATMSGARAAHAPPPPRPFNIHPAGATSPILLDCVLMPDRDQDFHLSLDMGRRIVIDGDEPPNSFSVDGDFLSWRSQLVSGAWSRFNTKTLEIVVQIGNLSGKYLCKRISGLE